MEKIRHSIYTNYFAREDGNIENSKGLVITSRKTNSGYLSFHAYHEGICKGYTVHRFICEAWHDNPENKPQVNHKDGNKLNCRPDNLEWCTQSENMKHSFKNGFSDNARISAAKRMKDIGKKHGKKNSELLVQFSMAKRKPIKQFDLSGNFIKEFESTNEAERLGFNNLHKIKTTDKKVVGGFKWSR